MFRESSIAPIDKGERGATLPGSETGAWYQRDRLGTRETRSVLRGGVATYNLQKGGSGHDTSGVGPTHIRGVARVMPGEGINPLEGVGSCT